MMIADEELRSLYATASAEHLAKLEAGLLHLENQPQDQRKLEELLRIAHSLKGDSRMLGVKDGETLTHHLEEILGSVHKGRQAFSESIFQALFAALDGIKRVAQEAISGEPSQVSVFHLVAEMMAVLEDQTPSIASLFEPLEQSVFPETQDDNLASLLALSEEYSIKEEYSPKEEVKPPASLPEQQTDTIRIESAKLDALLQYAGELVVTHQRLSRQLELVSSLHNLREEASKGKNQQVLLDRMGELLPQLRSNLENDNDRLKNITDRLEADVRNLQLLPFATVFNLFPRTVRDIAKSQNKEVDFVIFGADTLVDRKILEEIKDPLSHLIRNAVDHGIETPPERMVKGKPPRGSLSLKGTVQGNQITIEVTDDGKGLDPQAIGASAVRKGIVTPAELMMMAEGEIEQLIFRPGFSTRDETEVSEISGRGVGLDVVKNTIDRLQGEIKILSSVGVGTTFRLTLRASRSIIPVLLVKNGNFFYALPIDVVVTSLLISPQQLQNLEDKPILIWQEQTLPVLFLADFLQQPRHFSGKNYACVILQINDKYQALVVSEIADYQEIQIKPQFLPIPQLLGVTMLGDGSICHVLNPLSLVSRTSVIPLSPLELSPPKEAKAPPKLLLVEDSITIRTQLRRILESAGYTVTIAIDGADGLQKFTQENFAAIVSDVEMPNLSGLEMTERIRLNQSDIPIVLVTTLAKASDREKGLKAGANAYLTKGDFDQSLLLNTLRRLIS